MPSSHSPLLYLLGRFDVGIVRLDAERRVLPVSENQRFTRMASALTGTDPGLLTRS